MASGTITFPYNGTFQGKIEWSSVANGSTANNSTVTAILYAHKSVSTATSGRTWSGFVQVGNDRIDVYFATSVSVALDWVEMARITTTIPHDANGYGSAYISGRIQEPEGTTHRASEGGDTAYFDYIPRATPTTSVSGTIGHTATINISPYSSAFNHVIHLTFGNTYIDIPMGAGETTKTFTVPTSWYEQIPNASIGYGDVTVYTNDGNTPIGSIGGGTLTIQVDTSNCSPTLSVSVADTNQTTLALTGSNTSLITGYSTASVTVNAGTRQYATISSVRLTPSNGTAIILANSGTTYSDTVDFENNVNTYFVTRITDSRGISVEDMKLSPNHFTIINYTIPTISVSFTRPTPTGTTMVYTLEGTWWNDDFGAYTNAIMEAKWRVKEVGGTYSGWQNFVYKIDNNAIRSGSDTTSTRAEIVSIANPLEQSGEWNYQKAYEFEFVISDRLHTISAIQRVKKGTPIYNWYEYNDENFFNVNGAYLKNNVEIIENGTNYLKFADGNAICWGGEQLTNITSGATTAYVYLPFDFVGTYYTLVSRTDGGSYWAQTHLIASNRQTRSFVITAWLDTTGVTNPAMEASWLVIGKWK